jgi:hypothetical protein
MAAAITLSTNITNLLATPPTREYSHRFGGEEIIIKSDVLFATTDLNDVGEQKVVLQH